MFYVSEFFDGKVLFFFQNLIYRGKLIVNINVYNWKKYG